MIVGLTGGIGSGKTTVLAFFKSMGNIAVYIADFEAKKIMNNSVAIREKITALFGTEAYQKERLNREFVSNIVFSDREKLSQLNNIVHPEVYRHLQEFILSNNDKEYIVYESAILFENNSSSFCDITITVTADKNTRLKRIMKRDAVTEESVLKRINNQWSDAKKILQTHYCIENNNLTETKQQVERIHNILTIKRH